MEGFYALLGVAAVSVGFGFLLTRLGGLALFGPKRTRQITASAGDFCTTHCRTAQGICPLTHSTEQAVNCPLWRYVAADEPTARYGSPFAYLGRSNGGTPERLAS